MLPRERLETGAQDLFRSRLDQIINMNHELVRLAKTVSWQAIEARCGEVYSDGPGMPPLPTRLMAGLAILKHTFDLSDEDSFVLSHDVPSIFAGHYDPSFPISLCLKDLSLIKELMDGVGTRNELTAAAHARFREAGERYGMGAGEMTVCKLIEDDAGIDLRVPGQWVKPWEVKHPGA
jgi:hypothetical protein